MNSYGKVYEMTTWSRNHQLVKAPSFLWQNMPTIAMIQTSIRNRPRLENLLSEKPKKQ